MNSEYSMGHWRYEETAVIAEGELSVLGVLREEGAELVIEPASREVIYPETVPGVSQAVWLRWREDFRTPVVIISQRRES